MLSISHEAGLKGWLYCFPPLRILFLPSSQNGVFIPVSLSTAKQPQSCTKSAGSPSTLMSLAYPFPCHLYSFCFLRTSWNYHYFWGSLRFCGLEKFAHHDSRKLITDMKHADNCRALPLPAMQTCSESSSQCCIQEGSRSSCLCFSMWTIHTCKTFSDVKATVVDCMFSVILKSLKYSLRDHQFLCVKQEHNQIHSLLKSWILSSFVLKYFKSI